MKTFGLWLCRFCAVALTAISALVMFRAWGAMLTAPLFESIPLVLLFAGVCLFGLWILRDTFR